MLLIAAVLTGADRAVAVGQRRIRFLAYVARSQDGQAIWREAPGVLILVCALYALTGSCRPPVELLRRGCSALIAFLGSQLGRQMLVLMMIAAARALIG